MLTMEQKAEMNTIRWSHRIDLGGGVVTPGYFGHTVGLASSYFGLPEDLRGKTVLDIGTADGMFAFEAERRGGAVTAIDTGRPTERCIGKSEDWPRGFQFAKRILGSRVEFREQNLFDLDRSEQWDVVLFYGVLYHLKDPIGGLRHLAEATGETALIETAFSDGVPGRPSWEFRPGEAGDPTNQWYPSIPGLEAALKQVGFRRTERAGIWEELKRVTVRAIK